MADPAARASGWWDSLFGEPTRHARQPQSRGALLGISGYQNMPPAKSTIMDQRQNDTYAIKMADEARSSAWEDGWKTKPYDSSLPGTPWAGAVSIYNPSETVAPLIPSDVGSYKPSFQQDWKPQFAGRAPQVAPAGMGPQQQQNMGRVGQVAGPNDLTDSNLYNANYLPPIGEHLPIAPGDPRWTVPPSLSGPHNRAGDPERPGYGGALGSLGMTLNSVPQGWQ